MTTDKKMLEWLINHIELPLAYLFGHGSMRLHCVVRKRQTRKRWFYEGIYIWRQQKTGYCVTAGNVLPLEKQF
jgi:hypothetical protein